MRLIHSTQRNLVKGGITCLQTLCEQTLHTHGIGRKSELCGSNLVINLRKVQDKVNKQGRLNLHRTLLSKKMKWSEERKKELEGFKAEWVSSCLCFKLSLHILCGKWVANGKKRRETEGRLLIQENKIAGLGVVAVRMERIGQIRGTFWRWN